MAYVIGDDTSIQSTPMFAQSAAHALTFVRQRQSAFPKE